MESVVLPPTIDAIPYGCFSGCEQLRRVKADYVNFIGDYAFQNCHGLKQINFKVISGIGKYAFKQCTELQSVNNLADWCFIDEGAFYRCRKIKIAITLDAVLNRGCFYDLDEKNVEVIEKGTRNYKLELGEGKWDMLALEMIWSTETQEATQVGVFNKGYVNEKDYPREMKINREKTYINVNLMEVVNPAAYMFNMEYFLEECERSDKYKSYEKELKEEKRRWKENVDKLENSALNGRDAFLETRKALFGV